LRGTITGSIYALHPIWAKAWGKAGIDLIPALARMRIPFSGVTASGNGDNEWLVLVCPVLVVHC